MFRIYGAGVLLAGTLWVCVQAQEKPTTGAPLSVIAVFDLRACFDKENVTRIREIDKELKDFADESARRIQRAPEEREKLRAQYLELYDKRKMEIYQVVDQVISVIGKERGYAAIFKTERFPQPPSDGKGESLHLQMERRGLMYSNPQVDITSEVLTRLNKALAATPKKDF